MSYSAESNLDLGCRILPVLLADARLAGPASVLQAGFDELDSAAVAFSAAQAATRETEAFRDDAETKFEELVREFGMVALCACGNRPQAQPYILYFPNGYGALRALAPRELIQFAGQIVTLLEQETRPRLLSYRSLILESCAEFVAVQERYEVAVRAWTDARAYRKAALHRFNRALGRARTLSTFVCDQEPAYVKDIFRPGLEAVLLETEVEGSGRGRDGSRRTDACTLDGSRDPIDIRALPGDTGRAGPDALVGHDALSPAHELVSELILSSRAFALAPGS